MGLYSFLSSIVARFKMACLYPDHVIRLSEGIEEGGEIAEAIRAKWKAESDKQLQELLDKKERELYQKGTYLEKLQENTKCSILQVN